MNALPAGRPGDPGPESAWVPGIKQDGQEREGAGVCELNDLDLEGWPPGARAICRRERPHPGAQLNFSEHNGYRFQVLITDQTASDLASLEARHRAHARVEDRIRCTNDTGLENLPFRDFAANQVRLELVLAAQDLLVFYQRLCLQGEARNWEPKKLRYRLMHTVGHMISTGRRQICVCNATGPGRSPYWEPSGGCVCCQPRPESAATSRLSVDHTGQPAIPPAHVSLPAILGSTPRTFKVTC